MPFDGDLLETLRSVLGQHDEVDLAILFGSRARGRSDPNADVDLAIVGDNVDLLGLTAEVAEATGLESDAVDLERAGYPLLQAVLRDGIVVHQGKPHAVARFRTRAILLTETDGPWYRRMRDGYLARLGRSVGG